MLFYLYFAVKHPEEHVRVYREFMSIEGEVSCRVLASPDGLAFRLLQRKRAWT
jgi:hypothetical protein